MLYHHWFLLRVDLMPTEPHVRHVPPLAFNELSRSKTNFEVAPSLRPPSCLDTPNCPWSSPDLTRLSLPALQFLRVLFPSVATCLLPHPATLNITIFFGGESNLPIQVSGTRNEPTGKSLSSRSNQQTRTVSSFPPSRTHARCIQPTPVGASTSAIRSSAQTPSSAKINWPPAIKQRRRSRGSSG